MKRRGFTLIELMVVVAVIAVGAAIATPYFWGVVKRQRLSSATRFTVSELRRARSMAIARARFPLRGTAERAESAGLRVASPTVLVLFADADTTTGNSNESDLSRFDLRNVEADGTIELVTPAAGEIIRFGRDGSTRGTEIVLRDTMTGQERAIEITAGGQFLMD